MYFLNLFFPLSRVGRQKTRITSCDNLPNSDILKRTTTKQEIAAPAFKAGIKSPLNLKLFSNKELLIANCTAKPHVHQNGQRICLPHSVQNVHQMSGRYGIWALTSQGFTDKAAYGLPYDFHQGDAPKKCSLLEETEMQVIIKQPVELLMKLYSLVMQPTEAIKLLLFW